MVMKLYWKWTAFLPLPFPSGIIAGSAVGLTALAKSLLLAAWLLPKAKATISLSIEPTKSGLNATVEVGTQHTS